MLTDHFMIDIETYDTKPTAVILSIGAVSIHSLQEDFYVELNTNTQFERTASVVTKEWWAGQDNFPGHGTASLHDALMGLNNFLRARSENPIIWCKGTDFDTAILTNAYNQLYLPVPWKYNHVRDCRTVYKILGLKPEDANHNALKDAIAQAKLLKEVIDEYSFVWE